MFNSKNISTLSEAKKAQVTFEENTKMKIKSFQKQKMGFLILT